MSFIAVYADDMIVFDADEISVHELIANLGKRNPIEDKGVPEWFLGIKIHVGEKRIIRSQERYVKNLIEKNGIRKFANRFMNLWLHLKLNLMIKF